MMCLHTGAAMKNSFTIGEISELLGIPKSTLRYWEQEGLLHMPRNSSNNYRKYSTSSIYTISDLAHFRCLGMPLQEVKKLPHLSVNDLSDSLTALDRDIDDKLKELLVAKEYINKKVLYINEYKRLCENQYQPEQPDYNSIYSFLIEDTQAWSIYIKDQYQSILFYNPETRIVETGLAVPTSEDHPRIWKKDLNAGYVSFVLTVDYSNPASDDFRPHVEHLNRSGYTVTRVFARYLFSAYDRKYCDFYKAFAEVYPVQVLN